jgi:DeoR/GlpR family transcriptional regulator of sugar metabolism
MTKLHIFSPDVSWQARIHKNSDLKEAAAKAVIERNIISRYDHIYLDCGSTFVYLAKEIFASYDKLSPLTIYTTNASILSEYMALEHRDLFNFILIGGRYVPHHDAFDGKGFEFETQSEVIIDKAFIGVCPINLKLIVYGSISDVITIKQKVINKSSEIYFLCDENKFHEPPLGSRIVGKVDCTIDNTLNFFVDHDKVKSIPTRIIVGMKDDSDHSKEFNEFLQMANYQ